MKNADDEMTALPLPTNCEDRQQPRDMSTGSNLFPPLIPEKAQTQTTLGEPRDLFGHWGTEEDAEPPQNTGDECRTALRLHTKADSTAHISNRLDREIRGALIELSMLPGNVRAASTQTQAPSAEKSIPLDNFGKAKGDVSLAILQRRAVGAKSLQAKAKVLTAIRTEVEAITIPRREGWYDLGTVEGRHRAGALADRIGVRKAAMSLGRPERTVYRFRQDYRNAR